jgi:hypothetical protein
MPTYEVCSESNAQGEISIKWPQLKRSGKQVLWKHLFSVWRLQWATGSDQLFSCQSQSKSLRNHYPPPVQVMTEVHIFVIAFARAAKSQQEYNCWWTICMGTRPCQSFKQIVSAKLLTMKNEQNKEMNCRRRGCCCCRHIESLTVKTSMQLTSQRLWVRPSRFSG